MLQVVCTAYMVTLGYVHVTLACGNATFWHASLNVTKRIHPLKFVHYYYLHTLSRDICMPGTSQTGYTTPFDWFLGFMYLYQHESH